MGSGDVDGTREVAGYQRGTGSTWEYFNFRSTGEGYESRFYVPDFAPPATSLVSHSEICCSTDLFTTVPLKPGWGWFLAIVVGSHCTESPHPRLRFRKWRF